LDVTELSLGGVFVSDDHAGREEGIRVVHRALELGVNYIDTAPFYGSSQEVLGEALAGRSEPYLLGTKCGRWDWRSGPFRDVDAFKSQFDQTLRDLRRDRVDILYIHEADWGVFWSDETTSRSTCHICADEAYDYDNAPVTQFLLWAREQGLTTHLGISGNNAHLLAKVLREMELPVEVVLVAFQYSLIWRNAKKDLLPLTRELNCGLVAGAPLQQGRLAVPREEFLEQPPDWMDEDLRGRFTDLYAIHRETGLSLAELAIRFLLADDDLSCLIVGAATVAEMDENVASAALGPLPADLHARLDELGRTVDGLIN
jgi:L-galactose dehydrogenase